MLTAVSVIADAAVKTKWFYEVRAMAWLLLGGGGNRRGLLGSRNGRRGSLIGETSVCSWMESEGVIA